MTNANTATTANDTALNPTLETIAAREDALFAAAQRNGVDVAGMEALATLRDAVGLLDLLSEGVARGIPFNCPEAVTSFQWSIMKLVEFNDMLPEELRGDLSRECFIRTKAAMTAGAAH